MVHRDIFFALTAALCVSLAPVGGHAADEIRTERVHFKKGANSATIEGSVHGYNTVDYVLGARAGQAMNVSMATDNDANYFNIIAPGETDAAMFIGSTQGNQYEGVLPKDGDYKIRVYLMRNAARRKETARYRLEMIIAAQATQQAPANDALVPGTEFHATGQISCLTGGTNNQCDFGVIREGNGSGTVKIQKPDGSGRAIFFENGVATGYDASQADRAEFSASKESDMNIITIGPERYEIPDAVIFGG